MFRSVCAFSRPGVTSLWLRRLAPMLILSAALSVAWATPAFASHGRLGAARTPGPVRARIDQRLYGLVPSAWAGGRHHGRPTRAEFAASRLASANNLSYHGGPVMQTNTTYTIYWLGPSGVVSSPYESTINGFLTNVAAAKSATTDTYAVDTQYYGPSGADIQNSSTYAGSWVDTTTPIPDNCSSEYAGTGVSVQGCVLDSDIQAEVSRALAANVGWTPAPNSLFLVFTPRNVGSCFDSFSGECSYTYYCAYHSNFTGSSGNEVLYANLPYTETNGVGAPGVCASGEYPNGDQASDSTINVLSHEHNESITDPLGTAWYDSSGNEIGDKCAWNFGTASGPAGAEYNQTINGHHYYLQQEWSNSSAGCALSYGTSTQASLSLSLPSSFTAGQPQSGTVTLPSPASTATDVTLSSTGSGTFTSGTVTIPANSTSATFTYNDTKAESTTITASASGYTSATQAETVVAGPAKSLTISPTSASVPVGGSQPFTASGTDQYGNPANVSGVSWSTSAGGTLSPTTGRSTTFTATSQASGTVTASLSGASSASADVTVTAAPPNAIVNGGFETGTFFGWTASGASDTVDSSASYPCHSGNYCARLGSTVPTKGNSSIAQTFTAPTVTTTVSFYYQVVCTDTVKYDWATATLRDVTAGKTYTVLPRTCSLTGTWSKASHSVTAGHKYTLTLTNRDDDYPGDPTYTLYDDVSVQ
jgi:Phosphate-induced protein 1 conserved region